MVDEQDLPIFGYAKIAHANLIQIHSDKIIPIAQICFTLGKLLPIGTEIWVGNEIPRNIPENWIPLEVTGDNPDTEDVDTNTREELPNRTRAWYAACRHIVAMYHQRYTPDLEEISVLEIP